MSAPSAAVHSPRPLPPSLYADTARPAPETPPLAGPARVQALVVGGGFTGLSTALHLAESGVEAMVLEKNAPGWGASGRNGGQVNPGLYPDPAQVIADFGDDLGRRMLLHAAGAPDVLFALVQRLGLRCDADQQGTLRMARDPAAVEKAESLRDQWREIVGEVDWLDAEAASTATGTSRYPAGLRFRQGGQVNPLGLARALAEAAQAAGARVHAATPVTALRRTAEGWAAQTPAGEVLAEHVVLASNGYTDDLWPGLRRTVVPVYSAVTATEPLGERAAGIMAGGSSLYETGRNTVYYRLDAERRFVIGGAGPQRDLKGLSEAKRLQDYAQFLFPQIRGAAWSHAWNGQVAVTTDHYPHVHEPEPGLIACLGYNGRGVAMGTAMGAVLAQRINGAPIESLPMPFTGIKPMPFHAFWKPAAMARLAYGRARDRLGF